MTIVPDGLMVDNVGIGVVTPVPGIVIPPDVSIGMTNSTTAAMTATRTAIPPMVRSVLLPGNNPALFGGFGGGGVSEGYPPESGGPAFSEKSRGRNPVPAVFPVWNDESDFAPDSSSDSSSQAKDCFSGVLAGSGLSASAGTFTVDRSMRGSMDWIS